MTVIAPETRVSANTSAPRLGEVLFAVDPALADDARLAFIGRVSSSWTERASCPKNMARARETGAPAQIVIDAPFRLALEGLDVGGLIHVLTWLGEARRDLAVQMPRHASEPRGTFALRSPVRPNPIGLHLARITALDLAEGRIDIEAIDVLDGTAVLDIKPFFATVDVPAPPAQAASAADRD